MLIFPVAEVNELTRGKGVILQRFKDGGLASARVFKKSEGLSWLDSAGHAVRRGLNASAHRRAQGYAARST